MSIKTYNSRSNISINVVLPNKKNLHVSFSPQSDGSSIYITDKQDEQRALESHYRFGQLFHLDSTDDTIAPSGSTQTDGEGSLKDTPQLENPSIELDIVEVTDLDSAKEYLVDKFGISRTKLKGEKSIVAQALICGIKFEILN